MAVAGRHRRLPANGIRHPAHLHELPHVIYNARSVVYEVMARTSAFGRFRGRPGACASRPSRQLGDDVAARFDERRPAGKILVVGRTGLGRNNEPLIGREQPLRRPGRCPPPVESALPVTSGAAGRRTGRERPVRARAGCQRIGRRTATGTTASEHACRRRGGRCRHSARKSALRRPEMHLPVSHDAPSAATTCGCTASGGTLRDAEADRGTARGRPTSVPTAGWFVEIAAAAR